MCFICHPITHSNFGKPPVLVNDAYLAERFRWNMNNIVSLSLVYLLPYKPDYKTELTSYWHWQSLKNSKYFSEWSAYPQSLKLYCHYLHRSDLDLARYIKVSSHGCLGVSIHQLTPLYIQQLVQANKNKNIKATGY